AYELDLVKHPNRFHGLYGAGLAAEKTHNNVKAKKYYTAFVEMADVEHCKRSEIKKAVKYLKVNGGK
ncbi:MAG: hypothetical protein ABIQ02_08795, partial [Saprospiraceae bacterium]